MAAIEMAADQPYLTPTFDCEEAAVQLHHLRSRVKQGPPVIATYVLIPSPTVVEALGPSPYDALLIDGEHGPLSIEGINSMVGAAQIAPKATIVRLPEVCWYIAQTLDCGAEGILAPRMDSGARAADLVQRARYAPEGGRGVGPGRAAQYGADDDYVSQANDEVLVACQIETRAGLDNVDDIFSTDGLDVGVIGPLDLAKSLGTTVGSSEHRAAVDKIFAAADRHGVAKGAFAFNMDDVRHYLDAGATLIIVGGDLTAITSQAQSLWEQIAPLLPKAPATAEAAG